MAGQGESYAYRIRRSEDGKKEKWYKYNLNIPGSSQHINKFLSDFKPSELTRTAGYCCLEIGYYGEEVPANPVPAENKGSDIESPVAEGGDDAPEQNQGLVAQDFPHHYYVIYKQARNPEGPSNGTGPADQQIETWVHDFVPKVSSQDKREKRQQLKTEIRLQKESEQGLTKQSLLALGKQFEVLRGAWLFHVATGHQVDFTWRKLVLALAEGKLSAKRIQVVARDDVIESGNHMMSAHCADFNSQECVFQLEKEMRRVGVRKPMFFKPVIYSHAGIYKGNPWGIPPSLCFSQFDVVSNTSTIQNTDTGTSFKQQI